jgi:hypothetical protein
LSVVEKLLEAEKKAKAEGRTVDQTIGKGIDPYYGRADVGINPLLEGLKSTAESLSKKGHGIRTG